MNKLYYGFWRELLSLPWQLRLGIEFVVSLLILFLVFKLLGKVGKCLKVKRILVILVILIVSKVLAIIGREKEWAYRADERINEWGNRKIENPIMIGKRIKRILLVGAFVVYFLAILPDLPIRNILDDSLVLKVSCVKNEFQLWERALSYGYKDYEPLYPTIKPEEETPIKGTKKKIYIRLRKKMKAKAKIFKKPSLKSKVIKRAKKERIEYQDKYKKKGEKYWLKVYLIKKKKEGWILSDVVDKKQLHEIIK